jgi:hypothetical protein
MLRRATYAHWHRPRQIRRIQAERRDQGDQKRRLLDDRPAFIDILSDGQGDIGGVMQPPA